MLKGGNRIRKWSSNYYNPIHQFKLFQYMPVTATPRRYTDKEKRKI